MDSVFRGMKGWQVNSKSISSLCVLEALVAVQSTKRPFNRVFRILVVLILLLGLPCGMSGQIEAGVLSQGSRSNGVIVTVAGDGTKDFWGDGGAATSAELFFPNGVAVDSAGNLYIADTSNERIRKVDAATGIITTVAGGGTPNTGIGDGGIATSARLNGVNDVVVDSAGNLYISDSFNNRIRKVSAATGIITTVAGNGTSGYSGDGGQAVNAELSNPKSVALDKSGNLYIVDTSNSRIRRVDAATGIITTVAGNGNHGYSGDNGPAINAELYWPQGLAIDKSGNLYIADGLPEVLYQYQS